MPRRVLITGAAGYIANQLLHVFRERYDLVLVDLKDTNRQGQKLSDLVITNLADLDQIKYRHLFAGVDTVVHLGYYRLPEARQWSHPSTYEEERINLDMAYNVYKSSVEEGVKRVVMASSNHAADWYEHLIHTGRMDMVYPDTFPLSDNFYGWCKAAYEHLGFAFACGVAGRRLEVIQVRIGAPRELDPKLYENDPKHYKRDLGAYVSQRDLQQLFVKCIEADRIDNEHGIPFQIFYGVSNNARRFWSIANARKVIGYNPIDDSELKYMDDIKKLLLKP